ncbi:serine/threonine-protein kinase Pak-like [Tachypleus tridentatus]|uniref:serine/threonine-protein kinase Pak-like n=1 Tax=Tachypleus tridentatus TaxID=6853 RepID=UPI003FD4BD23
MSLATGGKHWENDLSNRDKQWGNVHSNVSASAAVYKATDRETGLTVAVKKIYLSQQPYKEDLITEPLVLREMKHPNVISYLDSYLIGDEFWVIMEYLAVGSLDNVVTKTHLSENDISSVCKEVLQGIEYLHVNSVIHRDIKSQNILVGIDWSIKLVIEMIRVEPPYCNEDPHMIFDFIAKNGKPNIKSKDNMSLVFQDFLYKCLQVDVQKRYTASELLKSRLGGITSIFQPMNRKVNDNCGDSEQNNKFPSFTKPPPWNMSRSYHIIYHLIFKMKS